MQIAATACVLAGACVLVTLVKRRPSTGLFVVALLGLLANLTGLGIPESDRVHRIPASIERAARRPDGRSLLRAALARGS